MKNICEELQLGGWTASQPKVDTWDNEGVAGLSSLAESSMKQHIIDGMITMTKKNETSYQMYVPKLRRGRSEFLVDLLIDYERMFVKESLVSRNSSKQPSSNGITTMNNYEGGSGPKVSDNPFTNGGT